MILLFPSMTYDTIRCVQLRYNNNVGEGVGHIEMLHCTSLIALVGSGDQPGGYCLYA